MRALTISHWGMTGRNGKERNGGSRNEAALEALLALLEGVRVSGAFIQTCGHRNSHYSPGREEVLYGACPLEHPDCHRVTAMVMAHSGEFPRDDANAMLKLARALRVPAYVVTHTERDETLEQPIKIARAFGDIVRSEGSWFDLTDMLRADQFAHESTSEHDECTSESQKWLHSGDGVGTTVDLSLSNVLRRIPGVRHADIDAILTCEDCDQPVILIESSSDGITPRESAIKSAMTTRGVGRRARVVTYLIQHQVGDVELAEPIALTKWFVTGSVADRYDHLMTDWDTALASMETALEDHWDMDCLSFRR